MVKLTATLRHFQPIEALVIGDLMLDVYTTGRVKRISPEAPVPVIEVLHEESRPGGAGNVVLNLRALGANVAVAGRIGRDKGGESVRESLAAAEVDVAGLLIEEGYRTPVKNRLIANSQQLLRVDQETITPISSVFEEKMAFQLSQMIPRMKVIALSDYGKGFLTSSLIKAIIDMAHDANVPVIVDPKGADFSRYRGAHVLKPNLSEAYAAARLPPSESLDVVARELLHISKAKWLLITRSEAGMTLYDQRGTRQDFPVRSREVKDVTGAGDTVLATISAALANGLDIAQAAQLANMAAAIAIERLGCAQVTLSQLAQRLLEFDAETKIFDDSDTFSLQQVLKDKKYTLLVLQKGQEMSNALFRALRQLSREGEDLIVYVSGSQSDDEFIHHLSSLQEVDYLILQTESLKDLCEAIHPHQICYLEQDQICRFETAQELLSTLRRMIPPPKQTSLS